MKKLLYIDGCIRGDISRTRRIAYAFLEELGEKFGSVTTSYLDKSEFLPLDSDALNERQSILDRGEFSHPMLRFARSFAEADVIVVAAPLWDMSVPAILKTYFEHVSVAGITFNVMPNGDCVGCCKAKDLVYLTTRGMDLPDGHIMEQGTPYLRALAMFFGIENFHSISAYALDMVPPEEVEARLKRAEEEARELARSL